MLHSQSLTSWTTTANINLTLKSLKPALTFALACPRTKSIAELKALLVETNPAAPPVEAQRWLFKGKALADGKLLQEYDAIQDGETVHMMVKAGVTPAPSAPTSFTEAAAPKSESPTDTTGSMPPPAVPAARAGHGHKGHPSLSMSIPKIIMDSDDATPFQPASDARASHRRSGSTSSAHSPHLGVTEAFRQVATSPEFWVGVRSFLEGEFSRAGPFGAEENARIMFEGWLGASKEWMTPSDIAKCREAAGISGMAGR